MKLKKELYTSVHVSLKEFVLLLSEQFELDAILSADSQLLSIYYDTAKLHFKKNKEPCLSNILNSLESDAKDYSLNSLTPRHKFPRPLNIGISTSKNDVRYFKYNVGELIDWIYLKYDLSNYKLINWVKQELHERSQKTSLQAANIETKHGNIKLETLPKMIQLQIDAHLDDDTKYNSRKLNKLGSRRYEEMVGALLNKKAKQLGIKLASEKDALGLAKINYQKVMMFLRPNDE